MADVPNVLDRGLGYVKLAEVSGTGASGTLTLTVPTAPIYRELMIILTGRSDLAANTNDPVHVLFNGDSTAAHYWYQFVMGNNATTTSAQNIGANAFIFGGHFPAANSAANLQADTRIWLPDYASASQYKPVKVKAGGQTDLGSSGLFALESSGIYESVSAITSIALTLAAGKWTTGSKATLLGLAA